MSNKNAATCSETIKMHGITHVLCVCELTDKPFEKDGVKYLLFNDLADNLSQDIIQHFEESNAFIKEALSEHPENKVVVHCN